MTTRSLRRAERAGLAWPRRILLGSSGTVLVAAGLLIGVWALAQAKEDWTAPEEAAEAEEPHSGQRGGLAGRAGHLGGEVR